MMMRINYDEWNKQMDEWAKKWRDQQPAPKEVLMHNHALREGCSKKRGKVWSLTVRSPKNMTIFLSFWKKDHTWGDGGPRGV